MPQRDKNGRFKKSKPTRSVRPLEANGGFANVQNSQATLTESAPDKRFTKDQQKVLHRALRKSAKVKHKATEVSPYLSQIPQPNNNSTVFGTLAADTNGLLRTQNSSCAGHGYSEATPRVDNEATHLRFFIMGAIIGLAAGLLLGVI